MTQGLEPFLSTYIDDLCWGSKGDDCPKKGVQSEEFQSHLSRTRKVLTAIREGGCYIKIEKAEIYQERVKLIGHTVAEDGIRPDPKKIKTMS